MLRTWGHPSKHSLTSGGVKATRSHRVAVVGEPIPNLRWTKAPPSVSLGNSRWTTSSTNGSLGRGISSSRPNSRPRNSSRDTTRLAAPPQEHPGSRSHRESLGATVLRGLYHPPSGGHGPWAASLRLATPTG